MKSNVHFSFTELENLVMKCFEEDEGGLREDSASLLACMRFGDVRVWVFDAVLLFCGPIQTAY